MRVIETVFLASCIPAAKWLNEVRIADCCERSWKCSAYRQKYGHKEAQVSQCLVHAAAAAVAPTARSHIASILFVLYYHLKLMDVPWVGRHPVNVGASLARSLKARKGAPVKQSKHLPVHDFYLFRCQWLSNWRCWLYLLRSRCS